MLYKLECYSITNIHYNTYDFQNRYDFALSATKNTVSKDLSISIINCTVS